MASAGLRAFLVAFLFAVGGPACATVINFGAGSCTGGCTDGAFISQGYGDDDLGGAGQIDAQYQFDGDLFFASMKYWKNGYGGVRGVAYGGTAPRFTLTGTPGSQATPLLKVQRFLPSSFGGVDRETWYRVTELDSGFVLAQGNVTVSGLSPTEIRVRQNFGTSGFRIEFGGLAGNIGLDAIRYSLAPGPLPFHAAARALPPVPVPATLPLLLAGLVLLGVAARRIRS